MLAVPAGYVIWIQYIVGHSRFQQVSRDTLLDIYLSGVLQTLIKLCSLFGCLSDGGTGHKVTGARKFRIFLCGCPAKVRTFHT